jgi:hypothetical protein
MLRKTFRIDELQCCSDVEVLVCKAVKNVQVLEAEKKSAWTDLDRVSFKKFFKESNDKIEKSAWIGLDKVKKASSAASVFNFLQDWSPGGRRSVLHFDGLPLTRGVVVATPFAAAVSLTFSLVKNLKMLLQAKRQPG